MGCLQPSFESDTHQDLMDLARQIAERVCLDVLHRLNGLSSGMSNAEARGYIRTRSAVVVHREVNQRMHLGTGVRPAERSKLIELATEMLVDHFLAVGMNTAEERNAA
jgi:hypothetical protein